MTGETAAQVAAAAERLHRALLDADLRLVVKTGTGSDWGEFGTHDDQIKAVACALLRAGVLRTECDRAELETPTTDNDPADTVRVGDPDPCDYTVAQICDAVDVGFGCTRLPQHHGQHVAGTTERVVHVWPNVAAHAPRVTPHLLAGDVVRVRLFTGLTEGWHTGHIVQADDGDLVVELPGPRLTPRTGSFAADGPGPRHFTDEEGR